MTIRTIIDVDPNLENADQQMWRAMTELVMAANEGRLDEIEIVDVSLDVATSDGLTDELEQIRAGSGRTLILLIEIFKYELLNLGTKVVFPSTHLNWTGSRSSGAGPTSDIDCSEMSGDDKRRCDLISDGLHRMDEGIKRCIDDVTSSVWGIYQAHKNEGSGVFQEIVTFLKMLLGDIEAIWNDIRNWITEYVNRLAKWIKGIVPIILLFFYEIEMRIKLFWPEHKRAEMTGRDK